MNYLAPHPVDCSSFLHFSLGCHICFLAPAKFSIMITSNYIFSISYFAEAPHLYFQLPTKCNSNHQIQTSSCFPPSLEPMLFSVSAPSWADVSASCCQCRTKENLTPSSPLLPLSHNSQPVIQITSFHLTQDLSDCFYLGNITCYHSLSPFLNGWFLAPFVWILTTHVSLIAAFFLKYLNILLLL